MNNGFITLHRKILEWQWYEDANVMRVFLHLLLTANHKDKKWKGTTIKRGQLATSHESIAMKLGLSKMQVRVALKKLKQGKEIDTNITPSYQLVTIVKYDDYQSGSVCDNTQITPKQHPNNTPVNTQITPNNNDNNNNNVNNDNNIRTMDIKVLKDAYVKNERLVNAISKNYKMEIPALFKRLDDFNQYLEMTGKFEMIETEYNKYFRNFIKKGKDNKFEKYGYLPRNHKDVAY